MANYVSKDGLLYFWGLLKGKFAGSLEASGTTITLKDRNGGTLSTVTTQDTVTTATTSGSGNAVTSITASNGALTVTKGTTFLTSHQSNLNLGQGYASCSTAEATVAKTVTLSSYVLATGGIVAVKFTYNVPANATLNINSKGAKSIFNKGVSITAGVINAGDIAYLMYDGTQYQLLGTDRASNNSISGLSVSGKTVTYTKVDGSTGTITTQDTDTKNTAGSTASTNKLYIVGATSQAANPQTYSNAKCYVGTDDCLYSNNAKVLTSHQSLSNYYTKTEIDGKLTSAMRYKGSVASQSALPTTDNTIGDMYNVTDTGANYVWDGSAWDETGMVVDLSAYAKTSDLVAVTNTEIDNIVNPAS